ncbi:hypothetical protein BO83DRAFT_417884 [Aspergillus eucalypticola CBS 122712]|uniref:Uncharacterized protein n=1 Tax=Aspergillus eucalypticola (strain CBS 122712 / IBT 29274) TaxID=1448314 RepID=A0A317VB77_ASPEC|nr:uncharacterized protein BO83DRAFT_417884 [Aspergillus eucalypticola CBS 122712]PWY71285.1 hypothetical protein BO83DRAFT_417884 [Aspergillus eucalypticola CBS 122712]
MHFNNVGLLATVVLASTASALPRMPHNGAVAAAAGGLDPSQKSGNLIQRSEEQTTASQDNAAFLFSVDDGEDSDDEGDNGSTTRHYHVSNHDNGNDLMQRSEEKTASQDNADFLVNLGDETDNDTDYEYDSGQLTRVKNHGKRSLKQRSEAGTATLNNEDLMYSATGDEGFPNPRAPWRGGKTERSEANAASEDGADREVPHAPAFNWPKSASQGFGGVTHRS